MDFYEQMINSRNAAMWPYKLEYGETSNVECDVLIIGGGLGGCFAAIEAAKRGCKVCVVEKGAIKRAGAAGTGIDHWMFCATNPGCPYSPDELLKVFSEPFCADHVLYIVLQEAYEALLDLEELGINVRDRDGIFDNTPMKNMTTGLLSAYDYDSQFCLRIFGEGLKPALYKKMKSLNIQIFDRTMATMLLTEDGKQGSRVIGATGVGTRTGRFYVFNSRATILATANPLRIWEFETEKIGSNVAHDDPNCAGDGNVMAWRAGAKLSLMERTQPGNGALKYPAYGAGNAGNTWYPCNIVDSEGKQIPWVDRDGNVDENVENRCRPAEGQMISVPNNPRYEFKSHALIPNLAERIRNGEYKLPFYADLGSLPESERYGIFGLMIGNEGKTRIPVFKQLVKHGFDPDKDMLQVPVQRPEIIGRPGGSYGGSWMGVENSPNIRDVSFRNFGGLVVDWDLATSLEGLYAVGNQIAGAEGASSAAATGRYAGRSVAAYVKNAALTPPDEKQIETEKSRIYAPLANNDSRLGWKEVQIGLCRVMQDYLGATKSKEIMEIGMWWLNSIKENELKNVRVNNPHELIRTLECDVRLEVGKIMFLQSLYRESTCQMLGFERIDYPETKPVPKEQFNAVYLSGTEARYENLSRNYWLMGENLPDYYDNYILHANADELDRRYSNGKLLVNP